MGSKKRSTRDKCKKYRDRGTKLKNKLRKLKSHLTEIARKQRHRLERIKAGKTAGKKNKRGKPIKDDTVAENAYGKL